MPKGFKNDGSHSGRIFVKGQPSLTKGMKRLDIIGDKNPAKRFEVKEKISKFWKGKPKTEEHKKKLSERAKERWNNEERLRKSIEVKNYFKTHKHPFLNRKHKEESKKKMSISKKDIFLGGNNPNWQGGKSFEPYSSEFNEQLKEYIRNKFNRICQLCGFKENGYKLPIHHIDYNKKNNNPKNLIPLCKKCNSLVNFEREKWIRLFSYSLILSQNRGKK